MEAQRHYCTFPLTRGSLHPLQQGAPANDLPPRNFESHYIQYMYTRLQNRLPEFTSRKLSRQHGPLARQARFLLKRVVSSALIDSVILLAKAYYELAFLCA